MGWVKCGRKDFPKLMHFLLKQERITLNITSRLLVRGELKFPSPDQATLFYLRCGSVDQKILAAMLITVGGDLYYCGTRPLTPDELEEALLISESATESIRTLLTIPEMTDEVISRVTGRLVTPDTLWIHQNYDVMYYNPEIGCPQLPVRGIDSVRFNEENDMEMLKLLHSRYLQEEVSTRVRPLNAQRALQISLALLKNQLVAGAYSGDEMVAKANTNMRGTRVIQLGGIYTLPEARQRGAATLLMRELVNRLSRDQWEITLFVKKVNSRARSVYRKCGFETGTTLSLIYFEE